MDHKLASEKVIVSSPASFSGSAKRIWKITENDNAALKWGVLVPVAAFAVGCAWLLVACWYAVFGIFLVPWRLFRRGARKDKKRELQHREMLESVKSIPKE